MRSVRSILPSVEKEYSFLTRPTSYSVTALEHSFEVPVGLTTALVRASGSGTTTVINLLLRLYQPCSGTIQVDAIPVEELRRASQAFSA